MSSDESGTVRRGGGARTGRPDVRVCADLEAITVAGRDFFIAAARHAIAERGSFRVALAGGSTPKRLYSSLVEAGLDWSKVLVFFGDERCVPPEHADSNYRMAREALLSRILIPTMNVHRIYAESPDENSAAVEYERELERVFELEPGSAPAFDLVLLGIGPDGHTASLFPGTAALKETRHLVVANRVEKLAAHRITFTARTINAARAVLFLVSGADKAAPLRAILEGPYDAERLPAQLVAPKDGQLVWLVDRAAAAELTRAG